MSTHDQLLATVIRIRDHTGDANAWQAGLTPKEVAAVVNPTTRFEQLDSILLKIRNLHPELFEAPTVSAASSDPAQGEAAEAIAAAEAALAHQNSASSQLDLQVIAAILNAHLKAVEGREALTTLQRETEAAVQTRSDLDTPAGARDFQRFLIGKLREIRAVVVNTSLDDTSQSALMAAWTSLYDASQSEPSESRPTPAVDTLDNQQSSDVADDQQPLDSQLTDDPGLLPGDSSGTCPAAAQTTPAIPSVPTPGIPSFGTGSIPAGWDGPGDLPFAGPNERPRGLDNEGPLGPGEPDPTEHASSEEIDSRKDDSEGEKDPPEQESQPAGPTTVTLPDGETVTAASPQLAAVISAAVGGTSIADAFRQQGITIPAPGTAITSPLDPTQVTPGDIGVYTDRHALALGNGKALLDGQIQQIAAVSGPSFLGWEHPPVSMASAPASTDTPIPTRPAGTSTI